MSVKRCWPSSPPDSITRSPAPSIRSKTDWLKCTVFTRSSGISTPRFASTPSSEDQPVGGDDEIGRCPPHVPTDQPQHRQHEERQREPAHDVALRGSGFRDHQRQDPERNRRDERRDRLGVVPPVRVEVDGDLLVRIQQFAGIRHSLNVLRTDPARWTSYDDCVDADALIADLDPTSVLPSRPNRTSSLSSPVPGRARPECSPGASLTGSRPVTPMLATRSR